MPPNCTWNFHHNFHGAALVSNFMPLHPTILFRHKTLPFQTGIQGTANQSPSMQNECKCDCEGPDAHPGTNTAPHQPGVSSEPSGCAGAALCCCPVELSSFPLSQHTDPHGEHVLHDLCSSSSAAPRWQPQGHVRRMNSFTYRARKRGVNKGL